jgi:hypothetical protein
MVYRKENLSLNSVVLNISKSTGNKPWHNDDDYDIYIAI